MARLAAADSQIGNGATCVKVFYWPQQSQSFCPKFEFANPLGFGPHSGTGSFSYLLPYTIN
jgi:hypothetical protein